MKLASIKTAHIADDFLSAALELIGMPACACDGGGTVVAANGELAALLGHDPAGLPAAALFAGSVREESVRVLGAALAAGGGAAKWNSTMVTDGGRDCAVQVTVKPLPGVAGRPGATLLFHDIGAMRNDQRALRKALLEQQAILENAAVGIIFSRGDRIQGCNLRAAEMFGYDRDEMEGSHSVALYPDHQHFYAMRAQWLPVLAEGRSVTLECPMKRSDGHLFRCRAHGRAIDPADEAAGMVWIIEDVSEQHAAGEATRKLLLEHQAAEESLRNALQENQAILDSAVLGICVVEQGRNLRCNAKMEEVFGYPPGELCGVSIQALYPDAAAWNAARRETTTDFLAGRVSSSEHQLVRRDGSRFWARLSGRPFDWHQPKGRTLWMIDDVTVRREGAEAIRRARDELEVRVLERTAELAGANAMLQGEIVERRQAEARVHHMAYHDSLTGLPNRALLADRLDRAMLTAQRTSRGLAVMFLDLDRFKTINDSLGHLTGDALLKDVAGRLCRAVRASDTVARLGGDEFVVLVPGIRNNEEAAQVAEKIIEALATPFPLDGHTLHITPSIGICAYPDDGQDVETLMRHADAAMYHAKAAGRNNYQFFTQKMNSSQAHFELESSLRSALAQGQFELHYQPIIEIATRRLHTLEVLLRWRRPGIGLVGPDKFIPIIEENGLIVPIGEWVIRRACEQSMEWKRQGLQPVPLAVNLSARQFMHGGLVPAIRRILDETGIDPALLEFEITETALMEHGEQTLDILGQINAMGIRLSIDDFGTGYSSLAYLKRFPVKKIKIDRAFVKDLQESAEDRAIVAAIIALSASLQLSVVAEGVETEGHFELLQRQGCQFAQGYLFSQPVPRANAQNFLDRADGQSSVAITGV